MKKIVLLISICITFVFGCEMIERPENLIEEEKMTDILMDIAPSQCSKKFASQGDQNPRYGGIPIHCKKIRCR